MKSVIRRDTLVLHSREKLTLDKNNEKRDPEWEWRKKRSLKYGNIDRGGDDWKKNRYEVNFAINQKKETFCKM